MKKSLLLIAVITLFASNVFAASYWVVLKDGSRYECKQKPVVANGKLYIRDQDVLLCYDVRQH